MTLRELVKMSSVAAYGHIEKTSVRDSANDGWVTFKVERLLKGSPRLNMDLRLCTTPPPMTDYPRVTSWAGYPILVFLIPRAEGCFELTHSYVSLIEIRDGRALTGQIAGEPEDQPFGAFANKVSAMVSER